MQYFRNMFDCLYVQIMNNLKLIDHNDQQTSEVEGYLRKLLRTAGGGELAAANSRNEQLTANVPLSPKSDVTIAQSVTLFVSVIC